MTGDPDREGPEAHPHGEDDRPEQRDPAAATGPQGSHRDLDVDSAFAAIVAAWGEETPGGVGPWPAAEDIEARPDPEKPADSQPSPQVQRARPDAPEQRPDEPVARPDSGPAARRAEDGTEEPQAEEPGEQRAEVTGLTQRPRRPRRGRHARRRGDHDSPREPGSAEPDPEADRTIELPRDSSFETAIEDDQGGEPYRPGETGPKSRTGRWGPAAGLGPTQEPLLPAGYGSGDLAGEASESLQDDDGRFIPPEPPPLPRGDLVSRVAWACVLGGPLFLLLAVLLWRDVPRELLAAAVVAFIGGFVVLVARMPGDHDGDGDGAVV